MFALGSLDDFALLPMFTRVSIVPFLSCLLPWLYLSVLTILMHLGMLLTLLLALACVHQLQGLVDVTELDSYALMHSALRGIPQDLVPHMDLLETEHVEHKTDSNIQVNWSDLEMFLHAPVQMRSKASIKVFDQWTATSTRMVVENDLAFPRWLAFGCQNKEIQVAGS